MKKFSKILIANRGEIALRIIRAAREMGIISVAVYSSGEEDALHVTMADEAFCLGNGDLSATYLNIEKIVSIAKNCSAQAIHPGYGFLSENPEFASECNKNGITFIGPNAEILEKMGNKVQAKEIAREAQINVLSTEPILIQEIEKIALRQSYPLIIKASYGGGGKGMQVVYNSSDLIEKAVAASRAAESYFGNGEIYLEKYVQNARHIEVQLLGDKHGNLVHLFERDCTLQRNHQKIIEEAPATSITDRLRNELHRSALELGRRVNYENAGTVEFLVDEHENFYFLEVNPRIQVEHPVTEQVTGIDLVKEQLSVAAGNPLSFSQEDIQCSGHSIEARIYAEDPSASFAPSSLPTVAFNFPSEYFVRLESDCAISGNSTANFDPLLAKIIVTGIDRNDATKKMISSLSATSILGPKTNLAFLLNIFQDKAFDQNKLSTQYCAASQASLVGLIRQKEGDFDKRFLIAAAIKGLFYREKLNNSIWQKMGFWRTNQWIELLIGKELLSVQFKIREQHIEINDGKDTFSASINPENKNSVSVTIEGDLMRFFVHMHKSNLLIAHEGLVFEVASPDLLSYYPIEVYREKDISQQSDNVIKSHLYGKIISVLVVEGQTVGKGDLLLVIESMKSENKILSPRNGKIQKIAVAEGGQVSDQEPLVYLEEL